MNPVHNPTAQWGAGPQPNIVPQNFDFFDTNTQGDALPDLFYLNNDGSPYNEYGDGEDYADEYDGAEMDVDYGVQPPMTHQGHPYAPYEQQDQPSDHLGQQYAHPTAHAAPGPAHQQYYATNSTQPYQDAGNAAFTSSAPQGHQVQQSYNPVPRGYASQGQAREPYPHQGGYEQTQGLHQTEHVAPPELRTELDERLAQYMNQQSQPQQPQPQRSDMANLGVGPPPHSASTSRPVFGSSDQELNPEFPYYWPDNQASSMRIAQPLPSVPVSASSLAAALPFPSRPRDRSGSAPTPGSTPHPVNSLRHPLRHHRAASSSNYQVLGTIDEAAIGASPSESGPHNNDLPPPGAEEFQVTDANLSATVNGPGFYSVSGGTLPVATGLRDLLRMLAIPNAKETTLGKAQKSSQPEPKLPNLSLSTVLGPEYIRKTILDFRGFWLEVVPLDRATFPALLPKHDVIDAALVIIISLWLNNYVASQMLASRTPITRAEVQESFDQIMDSVEVTVLLSIAAQVDLTKWSLEDVRMGWNNGPVFSAAQKNYYRDRVLAPLKPKVDQFFEDGITGMYDHIFRAMYDPQTCPDMASQRGNNPMLVTFTTDYAMSGGLLHFIHPDLKNHPYTHDVDLHELHTCQASAAQDLETIDGYHAAKEQGLDPDRCWVMWGNKLMTKAVSYLIFYFSRHAAVALRRFYDKCNPLVEPKETMDYASLIPLAAAMISVAFSSLDLFGREVTGKQLLEDADSQETFAIKFRCVRAFVVGTMGAGAPAANRADLQWFNDATERRVDVAISAAEGTRRSLAVRAYLVTWDPSLPWMYSGDENEEGGRQQADFLGWVQQLKHQPDAPPPPWTPALGRIYEEAIRTHDANVQRATEASLSMEIINMSHMTPKTMGASWLVLRGMMANARLTAQHDNIVVETIMGLGSRGATSSKPRPPELSVGASTSRAGASTSCAGESERASRAAKQHQSQSLPATTTTPAPTTGLACNTKHRTILPAPNTTAGGQDG